MSDTTAPAARAGTLAMVLVSVFIVGCLGFQTLAVINLPVGPIERAPFLFPFLNYPMYCLAHYEGEEIDQPFLVGVRPDLSEVRIGPADLGLSFFLYLKGPVEAVKRGDLGRAALYRDVYLQRHGTELVGLKLASEPARLTPVGYRILPERILATMSFAERAVRR